MKHPFSVSTKPAAGQISRCLTVRPPLLSASAKAKYPFSAAADCAKVETRFGVMPSFALTADSVARTAGSAVAISIGVMRVTGRVLS